MLYKHKNFIITIILLLCTCLLCCYNKIVYNIITKCIISSNAHLNSITKKTRGKNYWLTNSNNNCFITTWHIYHFVQYLILGIVFPSYHIILLILGIVFEILEKYVFQCDDILDIAFNILGLYIGVFIGKYI